MIIFFNVCIAFLAVFILIYLLKKDLGLFLLSFVILLQYVWMFFSLIVIESGVFVNEQGRNGYFVYSSLVLFCFYITTIVALIFFKKIFSNIFKNIKITRFKLVNVKEEKLSLIVIVVVFILALINLISSPIPLFSDEVTRFNFWESSKFPFLRGIVGNIMGFVSFGLALLYRYNKKTSVFLLIIYFTYLILIGQKFSGLIIGCFGILLALYYSSEKKFVFKFKWIINRYVILIFVSFFLLIYYSYSIDNPFGYLGLTPLESILYRAFGLQAHVFWGTTEQYVYIGKPSTWNISELWIGMQVLMKEFWPFKEEFLINVTRRGVNWTNAYPAILIRIFPFGLALIVNFFLMSFVSLMQTFLVLFIRKGSIILSIIVFQLLTWVSFAYTMAYFNKLTVPFIFLVLFFIYKYFLHTQKQEGIYET
jgi:hypothetical protein